MIVTIVCEVLGAENNGTAIATMNLVRYLRERGHTVRLVCPDKTRANDPDVYLLPTYNLLFLNGYVAKNGVALAKPESDVLRRAITGSDAVHIIVPFHVGRAAAKMAIQMGIPVTAGFHCQAENFTNHIFMMNNSLANHCAYHIFWKNLYRYCTAIHYPSRFICDVFEKEVGHPTPHYIISNGVNRTFVPHTSPKPTAFADKFVILFTGRFSKEKSHYVLIDAVAQSRHVDQIQLVFAGDGPQKENIRTYAKKMLKNPPLMQFFDRKEMLDVIGYADLYVHPAEIEIEAIACLEAISCGKVPVISDSVRSATRHFALDERNLFQCNNSRDLANKIDYWFEHPEEKALCSQKYEGYADQFRFEHCMAQMERMILDAMVQKQESKEA